MWHSGQYISPHQIISLHHQSSNMVLETYLTFNGNCREAMNFYKECLGGELWFQTIGESPLSEHMPDQMKESILHATLTKDGMVLMGSDMVPQSGLIKGNAVSMSLTCSSEEELRMTYERLANGGTQDHPIEVSFWGALFGDLTDKYGNHWLLVFNKE
jgi:PhnB protein